MIAGLALSGGVLLGERWIVRRGGPRRTDWFVLRDRAFAVPAARPCWMLPATPGMAVFVAGTATTAATAGPVRPPAGPDRPVAAASSADS